MLRRRKKNCNKIHNYQQKVFDWVNVAKWRKGLSETYTCHLDITLGCYFIILCVAFGRVIRVQLQNLLVLVALGTVVNYVARYKDEQDGDEYEQNGCARAYFFGGFFLAFDFCSLLVLIANTVVATGGYRMTDFTILTQGVLERNANVVTHWNLGLKSYL